MKLPFISMGITSNWPDYSSIIYREVEENFGGM